MTVDDALDIADARYLPPIPACREAFIALAAEVRRLRKEDDANKFALAEAYRDFKKQDEDRLAQFAAAALTGMMASPGRFEIEGKTAKTSGQWSALSMELARAMLAEFKKEAKP